MRIKSIIFLICITFSILIVEFFCNFYEGLHIGELLNSYDHIKSYASVISCSTFPLSIPTDDEKKHVYSKSFNKFISYKKGVFLTFDDGPSRNTLKIIDILNENNIKGTFFVVGKAAERYPDIIKKINESGMCLLSHTYTHDYKIYKSLDSYLDDLYSCNEVIQNLTNEIPMAYVRLPGGSSNAIGNRGIMNKIKDTLRSRNIKYIDWNVSSADAAASVVAMSSIRDNVINQCKNKNIAVVLMHDAPTKTTTVEALPDIIRFLKENGYVFRTFNDITDAEEKELIKRGIINK